MKAVLKEGISATCFWNRRGKRKKQYMVFIMSLMLSAAMGCAQSANTSENSVHTKTEEGENMAQYIITPDTHITELEEGLSVVRYEGSYGFDQFLQQGGASSDKGVVEYVGSQLSSNIPELLFGGNPFGCSTGNHRAVCTTGWYERRGICSIGQHD